MSSGFSVRSLYADTNPSVASYQPPVPVVSPPPITASAPSSSSSSSTSSSFSISSLFEKRPSLPSTEPSLPTSTSISPPPSSSSSSSSSSAVPSDRPWWSFAKPDSDPAPIEVPLQDFPASSDPQPSSPSSSSSSSFMAKLMGRAHDEEFPAPQDAPAEESASGSLWSRLTGAGSGDAEAAAEPEDDGSWLSQLGRNEDGSFGMPGFPQVPWFKMFEEEEPDCWKQMTEFLGIRSLSLKQRLYGFGICWALGFIFDGLGTALMFNLNIFATFFTFGNICNLVGTFFLVGPVKQAREMFDPNRLIAAIIYLISMGLTLFAALYLRNFILAIIMVVVQSAALFWYLASYVPFARALIKRTLSTVVESIG